MELRSRTVMCIILGNQHRMGISVCHTHANVACAQYVMSCYGGRSDSDPDSPHPPIPPWEVQIVEEVWTTSCPNLALKAPEKFFRVAVEGKN